VQINAQARNKEPSPLFKPQHPFATLPSVGKVGSGFQNSLDLFVLGFDWWVGAGFLPSARSTCAIARGRAGGRADGRLAVAVVWSMGTMGTMGTMGRPEGVLVTARSGCGCQLVLALNNARAASAAYWTRVQIAADSPALNADGRFLGDAGPRPRCGSRASRPRRFAPSAPVAMIRTRSSVPQRAPPLHPNSCGM
jgi:hypothetical protein